MKLPLKILFIFTTLALFLTANFVVGQSGEPSTRGKGIISKIRTFRTGSIWITIDTLTQKPCGSSSNSVVLTTGSESSDIGISVLLSSAIFAHATGNPVEFVVISCDLINDERYLINNITLTDD